MAILCRHTDGLIHTRSMSDWISLVYYIAYFYFSAMFVHYPLSFAAHESAKPVFKTQILES